MADNQITYTDAQLRNTLLHLCVEKFKREGSIKRNIPAGLSADALCKPAHDSVRKSRKHGLSAKKMERLLNHQVDVLSERYERSDGRDEGFEREHLRSIEFFF